MTETGQMAAPKAYLVEIDADRAGQRIDNFLITHLKGVPKSRVYRILRKGEVRVNKGRIKADYRLQAGDQVRIPPIRVGDDEEPQRPSDPVLARIEHAIVLEDKDLLVLNKPSGIAVHGGSGLSYGIIEALRMLRPEARSLELVHRLDRDTSGCLLVAKKYSVLRDLHEQFRGDGVEKRYLALLKGRWVGGGRRVEASLVKNVLQSGERVVRVDASGKEAVSIFEPVTRYPEATLVRVLLKTGRTHQIRVHAAHLGHPVAGDEKYGDDGFNRQMRDFGLRRLFLHAAALTFVHPADGRKVAVELPLDPDLQTVLTKMQAV